MNIYGFNERLFYFIIDRRCICEYYEFEGGQWKVKGVGDIHDVDYIWIMDLHHKEKKIESPSFSDIRKIIQIIINNNKAFLFVPDLLYSFCSRH